MIWYFMIGAFFGVSGYYGMRKEKKSHAKALLAFFGLLVGWPLMVIAGILAVALFNDGFF